MTIRNKRIRRELMKKRGNLCQLCQRRKAEELHHKNQNPDDNDPQNLLLLCKDCHRRLHKELNSTTIVTVDNLFYGRKL